MKSYFAMRPTVSVETVWGLHVGQLWATISGIMYRWQMKSCNRTIRVSSRDTASALSAKLTIGKSHGVLPQH